MLFIAALVTALVQLDFVTNFTSTTVLLLTPPNISCAWQISIANNYGQRYG